jgi:hypothetical protein
LQVDARELFRQLLPDHLDLRAQTEARLADVMDEARCRRRPPRPGTPGRWRRSSERSTWPKIAYRRRGQGNLHPADAALNLPVEKHSHGLRRPAVIESSRGSFESAVHGVEHSTGQQLGKRQIEDLAGRAAVDFDTFYGHRQQPAAAAVDLVVLSCDGKGVVTSCPRAPPRRPRRPVQSWRPGCQARNAGRKRMAEVGAIYDTTPIPRTPADILPGNDTERRDATSGPAARNTWLTASVCTTPRPSSPSSSTRPIGATPTASARYMLDVGGVDQATP